MLFCECRSIDDALEVHLTDWWLAGLDEDPDLLFNLLLRSYAMHEVQLL